jgi:exonuclease III
MSCPKQKDIFRLYSQNINGLKLDDKGGDLSTISEFINTYQCDVIGFSKLNLDVSKYKVKKIVADTLHLSFDAHHCSMSTSEIPFEGIYKPGGTLTAVFNHVVTRFQSKFSDSMGRWSSISLTGKNCRIIHFVTVYQVVNKPTMGPFTSYQQQVSSLHLADRIITPRKAFCSDLTAYLRTLKSPNYSIVLMGDMNEVVGLELGGLSQLIGEFGLVDVISHHHSINNEVATYSRGTKRLDYVFCTANLVPAVVSCGIAPFNEHICSDHRSIFVDWDEASIFGSAAPLLASKSTRRLQSRNLVAKGNYLLRVKEYCDKHNVFKRLDSLQTQSHPEWNDVEKLDRDVTCAMMSAEKHCRYLGPDQWSPLLKQARLKVEIYKLAICMARTEVDSRTRIDKLIGVYGDLLEIPNAVDKIQRFLRVAQLELKAVILDASAS